jgi:hypothetical protein
MTQILIHVVVFACSQIFFQQKELEHAVIVYYFVIVYFLYDTCVHKVHCSTSSTVYNESNSFLKRHDDGRIQKPVISTIPNE